MSRFIPLQAINVTNVFPKEPAPPGLNYYIPMKELPYFSWCTNDWNIFLRRVYGETGVMAGYKTLEAFGTSWWEGLQNMTAMELDIVHNLGYNPIFYKHGYGPVIWGNEVVGTRWKLPPLMVSLEVMINIKNAVDNLIASEQMSLFFPDDVLVYRVRAIIHQIMNNHRACRDLYCRDLDDPAMWVNSDNNEATFTIPISPLMLQDSLLFQVKLRNDRTGCDYQVAKESAAEYKAMQQLFNIQDTGILLED